jgi:hypothetical protein
MAIGAQGSRRALAQIVADVGQDHLGALAHEQMRRRGTEAHQRALDRGRRAGQQRYFALESHPVPHFTVDRWEDAPCRVLPPSVYRRRGWIGGRGQNPVAE